MDSQQHGQTGVAGDESDGSALTFGGRQLGKSVANQMLQITKAPQDAYLVARNKTHLALLKASCKALKRTDLKLIAVDTVNWTDLLAGKRGVHIVMAHTVWFQAEHLPMLQNFKDLGVAVFMR